MSATPVTQSAVERLAAARLRGADLDELLDLADAAIERASASRDAAALERLARELSAAALERGPDGRGLGVAGARASAAAVTIRTSTAVAAPRREEPEPRAPEPAVQPASAYASWGRRVGAFVVDWMLIVFLGLLPAAYVVSAWTYFALLLVVPFLYFTLFHGLFARTPGKLLAGTIVCRADGRPLGLGVSAGRSAVQGLLALTVIGFLVDALQPIPDERGQSLHDKAADTVVIRVHGALRAPAADRPGGEGATPGDL